MIVSASTRCDVHVIEWGPYARYHEQCYDSLKDEPITLHRIPAVEGDTAIGRWKGYRSGNAEFVSFVDDDDYVIPGVYERCIKALDEDKRKIGVHTREWHLRGDRMTLSDIPDPEWPWYRYFFYVHHVVVYRREWVMPYVDEVRECKVGSEHFMNLRIMQDGHRFAYLEEPGYVWRIHEDSIRSFGTTPGFKERAERMIRAAREADEA